MRVTKNKIVEQLRSLGVEKRDLLFVSSDLMKVGYFNKNQIQTMTDWIDIFAELLGPAGTIIIPSYTDIFPRFTRSNQTPFTPASYSNSGSLANAYIQFTENHIRSPHPVYSCVAVGPLAEELCSHTVEAKAYDPYAVVIDNKGKNLMLGTIDEKNCPMPFHYAQQVLGHTKTHPLCGLFKASYIDGSNRQKDYIVREIGGCTRGVHKLWGRHLAKNAVQFGKVGRSLSGLVDASTSYRIMLDVLKNDPSEIKCSNKLCISCYGRLRYNGFGVLGFYPQKFLHYTARLLGAKK